MSSTVSRLRWPLLNFKRKFASSETVRGAASLDASRLQVRAVTERKNYPAPEKLVFGHTFTDHMLTVDWSAAEGWEAPQIIPFGNLSLSPAASVLHYAFECFEGLKAFKDVNGNLRMFRPENNMARLNQSSQRICLPGFDEAEAVKLLKAFVTLEKDAIPDRQGFALYLRPTMISTQPTLGISPPQFAKLFVIASPVGPYYATGFKAIRLEATDYAVRAWPGGVGNRKLGANYAPCVLPQREAASRGFQQNLWLFDGYLTEVGTMNLFLVFEDSNTGKKELCTAPLDGTILEGITRLSILQLARERLDPSIWEINERKIHIDELLQRSKSGELLEVFGAGTAAIVSPVKEISFHGQAIKVPLLPGKECGEITETVQQWIHDIQYGIVDHSFCKVI